MRVAFWVSEREAYRSSLLDGDLLILNSLASSIPVQRRHAKISIGTVIPPAEIYNSPGHMQALVDLLFAADGQLWTTLTPNTLRIALKSTGLCVFMVEGLIAKDARAVDRRLRESPAYLGAIETRTSNEAAWAIYNLPDLYRVVNDSLRIFYRQWEVDVEDNRDHWKFASLKELAPFSQVEWEDTGLQKTIFDPYSELEYSRIAGEVEDLVGDQMSHVVNELFLRVAQLDPRLVNSLHGALKAFDDIRTPEAQAHVALSCRRLMDRLSDALFPPRKEKVRGRRVGPEQKKNRLWAYIEENSTSGSQRDLILASLQDVGNRVDRLYDSASKGVHAELRTSEVQRLLGALILVVYDILTVAPPLGSAPLQPYEESTARVVDAMRRDVQE